MKIKKWYVDEPDVGNMNFPLIGVRPDTELFDSQQAADQSAEVASKTSGIYFCSWETHIEQ